MDRSPQLRDRHAIFEIVCQIPGEHRDDAGAFDTGCGF
jgi:hypothetical protein